MPKLIQYINNLYGLNIATTDKVQKGFLSENYYLSDGVNKYFLKKYRFQNERRINEIHLVKSYFSKGGIPVILPIEFDGNKSYFEYSQSFYSLFPFVSGKQLERGRMTDNAISSMANMLGKIHLLGKDAKLVLSESFKIESKENSHRKIDSILSVINQIENQNDFDKMALSNIEMKRNLLIKNDKTIDQIGLKSDHLIHGDYLEQNLFFDDEDNVSHVFDFEKSNYSPRTYELFRSLFNCVFSFEDSNIDLEKASIYIKSYSSIYPISVEELRNGLQLYYLKIINSFWVESEHYLKNNNRPDQFLFDDFKRVKFISENFDKIESIF